MSFKRGDRVRILRGPLVGHLALFDGMRPRERCEVLLGLLGSQQRTIMPLANVESIESIEGG